MRRLAIVDVEGGQQPIANEDGTVQVVFNGEIYNHRELRAAASRSRDTRFASESDGEVIPHLYEELGPDFARHLDGIFAIALWDGRAETLMLARDQLGVKPLYCAPVAAGRALRVGVKALIAGPGRAARARPARRSTSTSRSASCPARDTLFAGVEKVRAGDSRVSGSGRRGRQRAYWGPEGVERTAGWRWARRRSGFRDLLRAAPCGADDERRPIGAMLSGGHRLGARSPR